MRRLPLSLPTVLAAAALLALSTTAQAQPIVLVPAGGPPGGSADAVLALDGQIVLMVQDGRLFRSADAGSTWTRPEVPKVRGAVRLHRSGDGAAYVSETYGPRVWRSADGGVTWTEVTGTDLRSAFAFRSARHGWFVASSDTSYVLRSTDEGRSWQRAGAGIVRGSFGPTWIRSFVEVPGGDVFLVSTSVENFFASTAVRRWQPDSLRWQVRATVQAGDVAGAAVDGEGRVIVAAYAGSAAIFELDGVIVSADGGITWTDVTRTDQAPPCAVASFDVSPDGVVRAATTCGVWTWRADGTWTNDGPAQTSVTSVDVGTEGTLYAASATVDNVYGPFGRGLYRRTAGATDWARVGSREATAFVLALSADARAVATTGGVWGGQENEWALVPSDMLGARYGYATPIAVGLAAAPWGRALVSTGFPAVLTGAMRDDAAAESEAAVAAVVGDGNGIVAVGDSVVMMIDRRYPGGLRRSTDRGRSFVSVDSLRNAASLARRADGRLFAAGAPITGSAARLWTSADTGRTWMRLPTPASASSVFEVAARDGTQTLYLTSRVSGTFARRLFRSDDGGQTWRETGQAGYGRLVVEPRTGWLFAPSNSDLTVSRDDGLTWETVVDGQSSTFYAARWTPGWTWPLAFDATGRLITAASDGGLLRSAWPVAADEAPTAAAPSLRLWPNPASGAVRIDAGTADRVSATVHDVLGRVVARLDGPGDALAWDASAAAPGVYVVRVVRADGHAESARLVVAR